LRPAIVLIPGVLLVGAGTWLFTAGVRAAVLGSLSRSWPPVRGRITESSVAETSQGARLAVRYAYEVDGVERTGTALGFASRGSRWIASKDRDAVRAAAQERYAAGREVDVFYWPARASVSVLEPGFHRTSLVLIMLGAVWLATGIALIALTFVSYA
jgi:Protein of unknown function (DUF3592)